MENFPTYFTGEHALSMTLRDYFAAKALPMIIETYKESWIEDGDFQGYSEVEMICVAEASYEMADAMLEARKK